jgi:glutathione S-transferase
MWQTVIGHVLPKEEYDADDFPLVKEWIGKMSAREGVKKALHWA